MEPDAYVLDTLACALWALSESTTFEEGLLLAVNLGGDADTVGAVYGQIAGSIYGLAGLSRALLDELWASEPISAVAESMLKLAREPDAGWLTLNP